MGCFMKPSTRDTPPLCYWESRMGEPLPCSFLHSLTKTVHNKGLTCMDDSTFKWVE